MNQTTVEPNRWTTIYEDGLYSIIEVPTTLELCYRSEQNVFYMKDIDNNTEVSVASANELGMKKEGCSFIGWRDDDGNIFFEHEKVNVSTYRNNVLYAIWTK